VQAAARGRGTRLLYWFRTPPGVRVGRAPLDETAIQLLEQHNPDLEFDWTRILKAPGAEPAGRRDADSRDRDQRGRREARSPQRSRTSGTSSPAEPRARPGDGRPRVEPQATAAVAPQPMAAVASPGHAEGAPTNPAAAEAPLTSDRSDRPGALDVSPGEAGGSRHRANDLSPAAAEPSTVESIAHRQDDSGSKRPAPVEPVDFDAALQPHDVESAAYARLGAEGLVRLRARYADVLARIAEQPVDADAQGELKDRAERLNPDAWVTADEVAAALEQYENVFDGLRRVVGHHPRRRPGRR
jgi:hypothetical protein